MDQWSKIIENLAERAKEKLYHYKVEDKEKLLILSAANDWGVARNGGRIGARFAPQSILSQFSKLSISDQIEQTWSHFEISHNKIGEDFNLYQLQLMQSYCEIFNSHKCDKVTHIGGGHDHIYPYLKALDGKNKSIVVFNIDAHLDTRTDQLYHSGTPFRQFAQEAQADLKIIQLGIHDFANPASNYQQLKRGEMVVLSFNQLNEWTQNFSQSVDLLSRFASYNDDVEYVFSLDCDAISAQEMPGVSALNHQGLPLHFIFDLMAQFNRLDGKRLHLGIYEYNPLFDTLSGQGARSLASLMYRFIYPA